MRHPTRVNRHRNRLSRPCFLGALFCLIAVHPAPAQTEPQEDAALLEVGKTALRKLEPLAPGETQALYFRVVIGPEQEIGYVRALLTRPEGDRNKEYDYHTESVITFPNSGKIGFTMNGRLRHTFEPIELKLTHSIYQPESGERTSFIRAVVTDEKITITGRSSVETVTGDRSRPSDPFIYGIESMVPRINIQDFPLFAIREFNLQSGAAGYLSVTVEKWDDGTPTIVTRRANGAGSYQFWFDQEGQFLRWGEPSLPVLMVRTSAEHCDELEKRFGKPPAAQDVEAPGSPGK